ncbi:MAG TPA: hypothetical protein VF235_05795 [Actinomycetota bacterium]
MGTIRATSSLVIATLVLVVTVVVSPDPSSTTERPVVRLGGTTGTPIPSGIVVSLDSARRQTPFVIVRPEGPLASDATVERVWITDPSAKGEPQVAIEYASGIEVFWIRAAPGLEEQYPELADDYGGSVGEIEGRTTIEVEGEGQLRSVAQVIDDVEVIVYGTLPIEDLRAVAASIG